MSERKLKKGCWYVLIPIIMLAFMAVLYLFTILFDVAGNYFTFSAPKGKAQQQVEKSDIAKPANAKLMARLIAEDTVLQHKLTKYVYSPLRIDTDQFAVSVYDITAKRQVFNFRDSLRLPPASCMKIATALASLETLGFDHRYYSSLQVRGTMHGDTLVGNLLLRADADPLIESLDTLCCQIKKAGIKAIRGNIYLNLSKMDTLKVHPTGKYWDIPYNKVPILLKGEKRVRKDLVFSLRSSGISYKPDASVKPAQKNYRIVATVSHLMRDVITPMIIHSSNIKADALLYHLDCRTGRIKDNHTHWDIKHYSETWMEKAVGKDLMWAVEPDSTHAINGFVINDGSGLSPDNRLSARFLVELLKHAYANKKIKDYFINEAFASPGIPGRSGSLLTRLSEPQWRNRLYCKTGTMVTVGTSSLAGYVHSYNNHWYIFSIINTNSPVAESRLFQDKICKILIGKANKQ